MPLLSSPPAQAASTIGSSRIAAHFADIPKMQLVSRRADARRRSRPFANERESAFRLHPFIAQNSTGPTPLGKQWCGPGPDIRGRGRAMWIKPRPADQIQPRRVAGAMCLVVTLETLWV